MAFEYELSIEKNGGIRISIYTEDADVALEINERIQEIAQRALDIEREKAEGIPEDLRTDE